MSTASQIAANQANSQKSTGPKTEAGIAASCQNNFRHGLSGGFVVLDWENYEEFSQLRKSLIEEHKPSTATQQILVERMAQHHWLAQRALTLQHLCFRTNAPGCEFDTETLLALYLRYQTTHENSFRKCLHDLLKLRSEARKEEIGSVSQGRKLAAEFRKRTEEMRRQELHDARLVILKAKAEIQKPAARTAKAPSINPADTAKAA